MKIVKFCTIASNDGESEWQKHFCYKDAYIVRHYKLYFYLAGKQVHPSSVMSFLSFVTVTAVLA